MDPEDNIQLPIIAVNMITTCILMSVHPQDSFSNKLDQLRKSTALDNQLTRLSHYINTGSPWNTLATDIFYWKRMDFLIVTDVFSKYFLVRKLANSTSAAICAELATILTEIGLPHIIRSDNGPCYNSKEFQPLLQCYNITHHTSSPHHPRSNGFVERMVRVAKKSMDKAGKEGKPWISGLYEYRVTP